MKFDVLINNFTSPPLLFFLLGLFAILMNSDLKIPEQISKFLSLFLLFEIGLKGGQELHHSGFSPVAIKVLLACFVLSFAIPFLIYKILRRKLDVDNSGAIAAAYGSISAVTFVAGVNFLETQSIEYGGYMMAAMALMESPAIVAGILLVALGSAKSEGQLINKAKVKGLLHESFFNGSILLLVGSLIIGMFTATREFYGYKPFSGHFFAIFLCFYMLDMGLIAGEKISDLKKSGLYLVFVALAYPIVFSFIGVGLSMILGLGVGDTVLFSVLLSSASHIAVPAAMRLSLPKANMSLLLFMSLCVTLTFNISFGIPLIYMLVERLWT